MSSKYCLSMSGSSVRRAETVETAILYLELGDWSEVRKRVIEDNVYQLNAESSRKRVAGELIKRLRTLTDAELRFLVESYGDDQSAMLWVAVCRTYEFVSGLSASVVRDRYANGIPAYTDGAYEAFFDQEAELHPELVALTAESRKKMRNQVKRMLVECGLVAEDGTITPIHPTAAFAHAIDAARRDDLDLFPGVTLR